MADNDDRFRPVAAGLSEDRGSSGPPSLHSLDKSVSLVMRDIQYLTTLVNGLGTRVETLGSNFATKAELAEVVARVKEGDDRFEKYTGRVWNIIQAVLLAFVMAVLGVVLAKTGYPH